MKLLKIFGLVLALHVILVPLLFLSPGCQSSSPKNPDAATAVEPAPATAAATPAAENWSNQPGGSASSQLAPIPVGAGASTGASLTGLTPAERARGTPSRPDNPEAYISTTTPSALTQAEPAPAVAGPTTHTVRPGDNLSNIAKKYGTTVAAIARLNPGLKADSLKIGDLIKLPPNFAAPTAAEPGASLVASAATSSSYKVRGGDTLSAIATRNGTTVIALRKANNLRSDTLQVGQVLTIPATHGTTAPTVPPAAGTPTPAATGASADGGSMTVTIQSGETLGVIAKRFKITVQELMAANKINDPRKVRAGQVLVIPGFQPVGGGVAPSTATVRVPSPTPSSATRPAATPAAPPPSAAPATTTPPPPTDLDKLLPPGAVDAPVVPVDEPTPRP